MNYAWIQILFLTSIFINKSCQLSYSYAECSNEKCHNRGRCIQLDLDETIEHLCQCESGFTGRRCEYTVHPCEPNPCGLNGHCSTGDALVAGSYSCECNPGYEGHNCEKNINDCLNATCYNGGLCIDGVNSYECKCRWSYFGRYCETPKTCLGFPSLCKNDGYCIDQEQGPMCICQPGYTGQDCSIRIDVCQDRAESLCQHGAQCISRSDIGYECKCRPGYTGRNCQHVDICQMNRPCKHGSTCVNLVDSQSIEPLNEAAIYPKYSCKCPIGYTGINCEIKLECQGDDCENDKHIKLKKSPSIYNEIKTIMSPPSTTTLSTTTITTTTTTTTTTTSYEDQTIESNNASLSPQNGSFVLILNIDVNEFHRRKAEIITEFEKRFGILMLIKKDPITSKDMIYPYHPIFKNDRNDKNVTWTKVYFILVFACLNQQQISGQSSSLCLQNNVNNLNDVFGILGKLNKASNLMPEYVSNISYEAYSNSRPKEDNTSISGHNKTQYYLTYLTLFSVLVLVLIVGFLLNVLVRQQKKIRAPVWFPPVGDNPYSSANVMGEMHKIKKLSSSSYEMALKPTQREYVQKSETNERKRSFEEFMGYTNKGFNNQNNSKSDDSPSCSDDGQTENEFGSSDYTDARKRGENHINKSNKLQPNHEYYPSPPESLSDAVGSSSSSYNIHQQSDSSYPSILTPANYKGANYGITPLMALIMGSRKHSKVVTSSAVDKYLQNGSDLNMQNNDGDTALHLACQYGQYEIAERLVKLNAELTVFNHAGLIPLHVAVCANQLQIVRMMLDYCKSMCETYEQLQQMQQQQQQQQQGVINTSQMLAAERYNIIDLKADCVVGDTALIMAVKNYSIEMVQLLIQFKANVNAVDNDGLSALHYCAKVNNHEAASILILNGAQIGAQDANEKTPLNLALLELGTLETANVLIQNNAYVTPDDQIAYTKKKQTLEMANLIMNDGHQLKIENNDKHIIATESHKRKLSDNVTTTTTNSSSVNETKKRSSKKPCKSSIEKPVKMKAVDHSYSPPTNQPAAAIQNPYDTFDYANSYYTTTNTTTTNNVQPNGDSNQYDYYRYGGYNSYSFHHPQNNNNKNQIPTYSSNHAASHQPYGSTNFFLNSANSPSETTYAAYF